MHEAGRMDGALSVAHSSTRAKPQAGIEEEPAADGGENEAAKSEPPANS